MLTKSKLNQIRIDMDKALAEVAKKHGLQFELGGINFSSDNFRMKLEANTVKADGSVETKEAKAFKMKAAQYGLKPDMLGKTFIASCGTKLTITGLNTRAYANPINAVGANGKSYKMPVRTVTSGKFV
jgi:hypothetical protein